MLNGTRRNEHSHKRIVTRRQDKLQKSELDLVDIARFPVHECTNLALKRFGGSTITGGKRDSNLADENRVLN